MARQSQEAVAVGLILSRASLFFAQFSPFGLLFSRPMAFQPMPLLRRPAPFDHPEWIFELKYDGFRSLAVIQNGRTQLISRNGNPFNSFADSQGTDSATCWKDSARWGDRLSG